MEENSKPMIWAGLVRAGLLTVPTISMRFEIFFCIFLFSTLGAVKALPFLVEKNDFAIVFVPREV